MKTQEPPSQIARTRVLVLYMIRTLFFILTNSLHGTLSPGHDDTTLKTKLQLPLLDQGPHFWSLHCPQ